MSATTEHFVLKPTSYVPNNKLPVIVYRGVLPQPHAEETTTAFLEANKWEKKGFWPGTPTHHFHPNTHECYGVVSGTTTMLLGRGQLDPYPDPDPDATTAAADAAASPDNDVEGPYYGRLVSLAPGDVVVIPAGTAHMNVEMTDDYRFVGVYPVGSPKWKSERCDNRDIMSQLRDEISQVPMPIADPVQGEGGLLIRLWSKVEQ